MSTTIPSSFENFRHQSARYFSTVRRLLVELVTLNRGKLMLIVLLAGVSVVARLMTFVLFLAYVRGRVTQEPLDLYMGLGELQVGNSVQELWLWAAAVGAAAGIASVASWKEADLRADVAERYSQQLSGRALAALPELAMSGDFDERAGRRAMTDSVDAMRVVFVLLGAGAPFLMAILAFLVMLQFAPLITMILALLAFAYIPIYYRFSRRVVASGKAREAASLDFADATRRTLRALSYRQFGHLADSITSSYLRSPAASAMRQSLRSLLLAGVKVRYLNTFFLGAALIFLLVLTAVQPSGGAGAWTSVFALAIVFRFFYGALGQLTSMLAVVTRYLPRVIRAWKLCDMQVEKGEPNESPPLPLTLLATADGRLEGSSPRLELQGGEVIALVAGPTLDGKSLTWFEDCLCPQPGCVGFLLDVKDLPDLRLRDLIEGASVGRKELSDALERTKQELARLNVGLDSAVSSIASASPLSQMLVAAAPALSPRTGALVVPIAKWRELTNADQGEFRRVIGERSLLIHMVRAYLLSDIFTHAVVAVDGLVVGVGDTSWYSARRGEIADILQRYSDSIKVAPEPSVDEDEDAYEDV